MGKELKNYKVNLVIILICHVVSILFNTNLFTDGEIFKLLYGIIMIVLCGFTLFSIVLINSDLGKSGKIAMIIGPVMSILALIDGFLIITTNFRVVVWFLLIGGILLFNGGRKLKNEQQAWD